MSYELQRAGLKLAGAACLHPSLHAVGMVGGDYKDLLAAQNCPVLVGSAGNDPDWTKPGAEWEKSSAAKGFGQKSKFYDFPDVVHGWSNRGDINDEKVARDVNLAYDRVEEFFNSLK